MKQSALNTVRFNDQLRAYGVILSVPEVLNIVGEILRNAPSGTQLLEVDEVKRQGRLLSETLGRQGRQLKHMKCLEALARLHGARNWHAIRSQATEPPRPAEPAVPARPVLDVMMGVQGLTDKQAAFARAHLEARIAVLLGRYDADDWDVALTLDRTPSELVRANTTGLPLDTPDDEVSDYADLILPEGFTGWEAEQLPGDVMDAILRARAAASKVLPVTAG